MTVTEFSKMAGSRGHGNPLFDLIADELECLKFFVLNSCMGPEFLPGTFSI